MQVTEVWIKIVTPGGGPGSNDRLLAFASITVDDAFVLRDIKIIEGAKGVFIAMPSRKLADRCGGCGIKNHLRARFCNHCGCRLDEHRATRGVGGKAKLHADVAHPINFATRAMIQDALLAAYADELELSRRPGYVSRYDVYGDGHDDAYPVTWVA